MESYSRGRRSAIKPPNNVEYNLTDSITFLMGFFILKFQKFRQKAPNLKIGDFETRKALMVYMVSRNTYKFGIFITIRD